MTTGKIRWVKGSHIIVPKLFDHDYAYIFQAPELAVWPGLAIALAVLGLNMLGDGLRDLLDPRSK